MTGQRIYLDHNASAPLVAAARAAMVEALDVGGNPSSVHAEGRRARSIVEGARADVAALVGAQADCVVFTGGASEAASTCLSPLWLDEGRGRAVTHLAVLDTDHPAFREGGRFTAAAVTRLPVTADGAVDLSALQAWLADLPVGGGGDAMLAVGLANSETGVIQPVAAIRERLVDRRVLLVIDAAQAAGRIPVDVDELGADALILSAHKIGGPAGIGAIVTRRSTLLPAPLVTGGGQERRRRAGTEAVPAIAGFGAAARVALEQLQGGAGHLLALRQHLERRLAAAVPSASIIGAGAPRLPNTVLIAHPHLRAETAQIAFDLNGIAVSAGSACTSGKVGPSHVLSAMHAAGSRIEPGEGAIRISFGYETEQHEIDRAVEVYASIVARSAHAPTAGAAA
ncbi:cysteine desulfurase family protein [Mangrovicella endophytica]|uniref:cysteine desulfurase family protein n=1 Tax=Mangrovicella endophytica TaxID=2066697 RepID=UPI000C9E441A|nr:cysteine desulfurase family protein [Mangrovicella endophytica]